MTNCLFCKMANGTLASDKIYEDEQLFVIKDIHPKAKVHLLIIPKLHIENLMHTENHHRDLLGDLMIALQKVARQQRIASFKTLINTGKNSGQEIFHLHIHLLSDSLGG